MSGQWEVVGKKKDRASKLPIAKNNTNPTKNKKNSANDLKIEDILPKSQVQNLYSNKSNKENKKPIEKPKKEESNQKKNSKKEKSYEPTKPKHPKSIESALNAIDQEEFKNIFDTSQNHFPDTPIIWLKELLQFLNQKMPIEVQDTAFSSKKEGYPLNVVPSGIKTVIEKAFTQAGKNNTQLFFDICLTSMASDMSKDLPALGNKILLQYIALNESSLITTNLNKYITLKNSYQNRPNIGLSILWAVGQVGIYDFQCGFEVFQLLFLPLLELKNYSRYIAQYLLTLLTNKEKVIVTKEQFILLLDTIYSNKKHFPLDLKRDLAKKLSDLQPLLFVNKKEKYQNLFDVFFKKLVENSNKSYQDCLCDILIEIFHKDETTLINWNKAYSKNIVSSGILLKYIGDNWSKVSKKIGKGAFSQLLESFTLTNEEYSKKKNIEGLKDSVEAIKTINEIMAAKNNSGSVLKTLLIVFFVISQIVIGIFLYDAWQTGKIDEVKIKQKLQEFGVYSALEYVHKIRIIAEESVAWICERIDDNFPGYRKIVIDATEPYVHLLVNCGKLVYVAVHNIKDIIVENYPQFLQNIEYYAPGLLENSQKMITNAYLTSSFYVHSSVDYLKKEIFIGQLSPENVQRMVSEALNTTQQKASEYYHWIYEKVQTTIK